MNKNLEKAINKITCTEQSKIFFVNLINTCYFYIFYKYERKNNERHYIFTLNINGSAY